MMRMTVMSLLLLLSEAFLLPCIVPTAFAFVNSRYHHQQYYNHKEAQQGRISQPYRLHLSSSDGANPPPFGNWMPAPASPPTPSSSSSSYGSSSSSSSWNPPAMEPPASTDNYSSVSPSSSPGNQQPAASVTTSTAVGSSNDNVMASLITSQRQILEQITSSIPDLNYKADLSFVNQNIEGSSTLATMQAWDAPGASNIAWLASVEIPGQLCSCTIFNGPLTDVPHILSRVACTSIQNNNNPTMLEVAIDVRPRAYGGYELVDANGNYPGPEQLGRKAFEYSAARNEYFSKFATPEIQNLLDNGQFEGATPVAKSDLDIITGGPIGFYAQMPATDRNVNRLIEIRQKLLESWLTWQQTTPQHRPGAPINTQYVYDAKFRQNAYSALLPHYSRLLSNDAAAGATVAAAESGPLDEAYVGGAS